MNTLQRWLACLTTSAALAAPAALCAEPLAAKQTIERALVPGSIQVFDIAMRAGDYVAGAIEQRGTVVTAALFAPDGQRVRTFKGHFIGKLNFSFVSEVAGAYRLELQTVADAGAGSYALRLGDIVAAADQLQSVPADTGPQSPRIATLRTELAAGKTNVAAFWSQVGKEGTPLLETRGEEQFLVTFLWRGSAVRSVHLIWPIRPLDDFQLTRLPGTDLWYRTVLLPRGTRVSYKLAPDVPRLPGSRFALQAAPATAQADPLNPQRWGHLPGASAYEYSSLLELPGAAPQLWAEQQPGVASGKVTTSRFTSRLMNNERAITVYTPAGYAASGKPYPLLVVFDAEAYLDRVPTPTILDNLIAAGKIPPLTAVFIGNASIESRNTELPPNPAFADFLATELIPWVHANYRVAADPAQVVLAGSSFGGLAAAYTALRHPATFGNVLSQSGSFWWGPAYDPFAAARLEAHAEPAWLISQFATAPKAAIRFYLEAGWFETSNGSGILDTNRFMRDVLRAKGYEVHYREFAGGHDYACWRGTFADGLLALMGAAPAPTRAAAGRQ